MHLRGRAFSRDVHERRYVADARPAPGERDPSARRADDAARAALRQRILHLVEREPGASPSELVRRLGIGWSSLYRHVRALREAGLVRVVESGRHTFLYPRDADGDERHAAQRAVILAGRARLVAAEAAARPGQDVASLAKALAISPRVVYHHVKRLVAVGLLESSAAHRYRDLAPTPRLLDLLREVEP